MVQCLQLVPTWSWQEKIDSVQERSVGETRSTICEGCDSEHRKVSVHNPKVPPTEAKILPRFFWDHIIYDYQIFHFFLRKKALLINNCTGG